MAYNVIQSTNTGPKIVATVASIDAGEDWLKANTNLICFERDPDGHDAADAFAIPSGTMFGDVYAIERSK